MQNLRNQLIAGGAVLLLAAIGTMMNRQAMQAAGGPSVTIESPIPLPVTGTVAVTGSTTVSGTVAATQSGTWNVGLTGTPNVHVTNPITAPVPVLDISKSASQIVNLQCPRTTVLVCNAQGSTATYVVPPGQNLVVTSVDLETTLGGGIAIFQIFPPSATQPFGLWEVPANSVTASFQYPSGIVFPAGFAFSGSNLQANNGISKVFLRGYLTSN